MASYICRGVGLIVVLFTFGQSGWLPIDSITNRQNKSDVTCNNNARSVVADPFGNIHIVWRGQAPDTWQVWYSFWDAQTRQWSEDTVISADQNKAGDPAIACDSSGNIYVAWITRGVLKLKRRDAVTNVWLPAESLVGNHYDSAVSIAIDRNGVQHLTWVRLLSINAPILYVPHDTGWGRIETVSVIAQPQINFPSIASTPEGDLMVVWREWRYPYFIVLARRRIGGVWTEIETVYNQRNSMSPCVCWSEFDSTFNVIWVVDYGNDRWGILFRARGSSGWGDTLRLSDSLRDKKGPSIVVDEAGELHTAWSTVDTTQNRFWQICCRKRSRTGQWGEMQVLTEGGNKCERVSIAAQSGRVQVAWTEVIRSSPLLTAVRLRRYEKIHDVGVMRIEQPGDTVDSAAIISPAVWVKNYGDFPESSVKTYFHIGDSVRFWEIETISAGESTMVVFDSLPVSWRGLMAITCSVSVWGDINRVNDILRKNIFVRVQDVMLEEILAPPGRVGAGFIRPRIRVKNCGNVLARFVASCSIFTASQQILVHNDSIGITLGAGVSRDTGFRGWDAEPDSYVMRVRISLTGDMHPENDTASEVFWVLNRDFGVSKIIYPVGVVDSGQGGCPKAIIKNYGETAESVRVRMKIGQGYSDFNTVWLEPGDSVIDTFNLWEASSRDYNVVSCSTTLAGDRNPNNNRAIESVFVRVRDAGVDSIIKPGEIISRGELEPEVIIKNFGNVSADISAYFKIVDKSGTERYLDSVFLRVGPERDSLIKFRSWQASSGSYLATSWTYLDGDMRADNDSARRVFSVESLKGPWQELLSIPRGAKNRPVRAGGCLVSSNDAIYALKGGGCPEFWRYEPVNDTWSELAPMPLGQSGKKPKAGAAMCWDRGNFIYALKGRNTREFWVYDIAGDSWISLAGLPEYTRGVRFGSGLVFWGDKVFCLKGSGTNDLLVYWVRENEWHARRPVPRGVFDKPVKRGSGLVNIGERLFCLKGGTNEFYEYLPNKDTWRICAPLPFGRGIKRCREGAALAGDGSQYIYAFKGGRTNEFWRYDVLSDSWEQLEDIPLGLSWRRVGPGGALAFCNGKVFALKGGGSRQFWCYEDERWQTGEGGFGLRSSVLSPSHPRSSVQPSTSTLALTSTYSIFDVSGRIRRQSRLEPGVYFIIGEKGARGAKAKKLIVYQRALK
ncbi:MAG: hypothetical protein ABIK42_02290 [candidate division WOR-3 bacterium]